MQAAAPTPRLRLGVLGLVIVSLFAVMLARLWYLQVVAAPTLQKAATVNRVRLVYEPALRGRILDRKGRVLVDNRVSNVVTVARAELTNRDEVLSRLSALLAVPVPDLAKKLEDKRFSPYKPVPVAEDVKEEAVVYIREHQDLFPGVEASQQAERSYPAGTAAAHLLGYVGETTDRELADRRLRGYRLGDNIGKSGVEQVYEDQLRGQPGVEKLEVDSRGHVLRTLGTRPPIQGNDIQLTLDLDIQKLAEDSLQQGLALARATYDKDTKKNFVAPAGAVVVLDPRDGSVLALASNPSYDPAMFVNGIRSDLFASLQDPAGHFPLNDRATQGLYAPGSTFKLVTSIAALKAGVISGGSTYVDTGIFKIPGRCTGRCTFHNAGNRSYGRVDLPHALTVSSDVFYYNLGNTFWSQRNRLGDGIQATARDLGFGAATGVRIPELKGRIPDPEIRKRLHEQNPKAFPDSRWFAGDNVNLAIGQGEVAVTPLQLAQAYATFANGGTVFAPRVAAAVLARDTAKPTPLPPVEVRKVDLPPPVRDPILAGLVGATADPKGTAHPAFANFPLDRFPVAGKTGTAQVANKQDTALFVAVAPANSPQYVISVVMEESGFGGAAAAPVARRILEGLADVPVTPVTLGVSVD